MIRKTAEMVREQRENMRGGDGVVTLEHYFKPEEFTARTRLCARLILPPGAGIGPHQHNREDELYLVLRGQGVLEEGEKATPLGPGDAVLTGNGASHALRNTGAEDLEIAAVIMCYE